MEAVKQGSATIGIKSSTHVVLVALKVCWNPMEGGLN
jgi:20S proteasome alpha/beta subunit